MASELAGSLSGFFLSIVLIVLLFLYFAFVVGRRRIVNALNQRGIAAAAVDLRFKRGIDEIRLDPLVKRWVLWLALVTLAAFLVSGFVPLPAFSALLIASIWLAFALWAAAEFTAFRPEHCVSTW